MQLKSAPGWLLDDKDLLDEQGVSIATSPPVSSRKGSPKGTATQSLSEPTCTSSETLDGRSLLGGPVVRDCMDRLYMHAHHVSPCLGT